MANAPSLSSPLDSLSFQLGMIGKAVTARFADRIADSGLRPHLVAMLAVVAEAPATQQDTANRLGVVPSAVVDAADQLERLGALERNRDPRDRRRQLLRLTPQGRALLRKCAGEAAAVDADLAAALTDDQRATLEGLIRLIGAGLDDPLLSAPARGAPDRP